MNVLRPLLVISFLILSAVIPATPGLIRAELFLLPDPDNSPPVAISDEYNVHGSFETPIESPRTGVLKNDSDPDGDSLSCVTTQVNTTLGTALVYANGKAAFVPASGQTGSVNIPYTVCDSRGACSQGQVTFHVMNAAPFAGSDTYDLRSTSFETPSEIPNGVLKNDSDPDGDPIQTFFVRKNYPQGTGIVFGTGKVSFVRHPDYLGFTGTLSMTYTLCDNLGACSEGTVTFHLIGEGENDGACSPCYDRGPMTVGAPINVTNGNMYLQQTDYSLPGVGHRISLTRTYNSNSQRVGLFGRGWSSEYDESIISHDSHLARLHRPDGRAVYLGNAADSSSAFSSLVGDFHGSLIPNAGSGFSLTMTNGDVRQFNPAGKLVSITDRLGNHTTIQYDLSGKLTSVTDPFGRVLLFTTDTTGQVRSIADSMGIVASYTYGANSQLQSITYADNSTYQFIYDNNLRLLSVTDALGHTVESHTYDSLGRALTSERHGGLERYTLSYISQTQTDVTDGLGRLTKYTFDKSKGRNVVTRVEGLCNCGGSGSQILSWTYDNQLNVISKSDGLNHITTFSYDGNGNRLTTTNATGTVTFTYNQLGQVLTRTDQLGGFSNNTYDAGGNLLRSEDALNNTTTFTYNARGQVLAATNARGKVTTYTYDAYGNLTQSKDANNIVTFFFYDPRARLTKVRDGLSRNTFYGYDAAGRIERITHADQSFVSFDYDLAGRRISATNERGNTTSYAYDPADRLITTTDALGSATNYFYDAMSNVTAITDALGRVTNYEHDNFDRVVKITYPVAAAEATRLFETIDYDAAGNVKLRTDTDGRTTIFTYDQVNRLASTVDAASKTTSFEYDALSRATALVDALNQRYEFTYDALGRQTRVTRAGMAMNFVYDAVGNVTQRTDFNGAVTNYAYDNLNRLTSIVYPGRTVTYGYTAMSQLSRATNENGSVYIGYDNRYRVSSFSDPFYYGISYNYDAAGNRTKLSLNGATHATYSYDAVNRLTSLKDGANLDFPHTYDAANRLVSRGAPNGVTSSYAYDDLDRLTMLTHSKGADTLIANQYSYNDAHNIASWSNASGNHSYVYDQIDRLTSATNNALLDENYSYDSVGNRASSHLSASYGYQPFNKLRNTATASYNYDNNGSLLSKTDPSGTTTFSWNEENQLTRVVLASGLQVNYKYDALGRRIQRTTSVGANERYVYDAGDVLLDLNADWSVAAKYLNGPGIDNHFRQTSTDKSTGYFLTDHLGSTAGLTDSTGNLIEQTTYDSFGNSSGDSRTRYGYTGRERDPDTGLMYYRARFYDSQVGRFISEDPIGLAGGINQFAYVSNNPLNRTDPYGLYEIDVHYYLTYFLAIKTGCFSAHEARLIADADQSTDENPATRPGPGASARQRRQNRTFHALHNGAAEGVGSPELWRQALSGKSNLVGLGQYLHYLQDSFSHSGFHNDTYGHFSALHYYDKTAADVPRALRMAGATWSALNAFAKEKKCGCQGRWDPSWWTQVVDFSKSHGANFGSLETIDSSGEVTNFGMTNNSGYLRSKVRILNVPFR